MVGKELADHYAHQYGDNIKQQYAAYYTNLLDEIGPSLMKEVDEYLKSKDF